MHQETLLYMAQQLPVKQKKRPRGLTYRFDGAAASRRVRIAAGRTVLGADPTAEAFGWDNEFPGHVVDVPAFTIDATPVRVSEYLAFVEDAGYQKARYWDTEGWAWRERMRVQQPAAWSQRDDGRWLLRTLFDELPLERVMDWPVCVSWAEARAFTRWRGARLPTEAELHRAAFATPHGEQRRHPWGDEAPEAAHGNYGYRALAPTPVGSYPTGASAWGIHELVGNGWEWTGTPFAPFPGFVPMPHYAGYSADFFDGRHYVLIGASWATDTTLIRRSFRNWFQPHYPYVFSKFRCVTE
jgi:iron(II)-dependent oxidoreductase